MKIITDSVNINFEYFNSFDQKRNTVLMLHGFTGSLDDWREIHGSLNPNFNYVGISAKAISEIFGFTRKKITKVTGTNGTVVPFLTCRDKQESPGPSPE